MESGRIALILARLWNYWKRLLWVLGEKSEDTEFKEGNRVACHEMSRKCQFVYRNNIVLYPINKINIYLNGIDLDTKAT